MRRSIVIATAIILLGACSTKEIDIQTPARDVVFYASFEQPGVDGTKVYVNENLYLRWTTDDRVSIFNKNTYNQEFKFLGETGDNSGEFSEVSGSSLVTGNPISHVVSVYPYQEGTKISEEEILTLTLPAEQHYAENTFGLGANTMVSVSEDNVLQYKNVGGYLRISLYGEGVSVSSITLKGNNSEKLAGKASVTVPLEGMPSVVLANDATDEITLVCDSPVALNSTTEGSVDFWFVVPVVSFSSGFTVCIAETSGGVFDKSTSNSITIERNHLTKMSPFEVDLIMPDEDCPIPDAVDLGLSVKWASFNLGATKPEELGHFYAWGETEPYYSSLEPLIWKDGKESGYDWPSYKWSEGSMNTITKYCVDSSFGYNGFFDGKTTLDLKDDAAHVKLGSKWRIPNRSEQKELLELCVWEWTSLNGVSGMNVTGPNGNSIFLPVGGYLWIGNYLYFDPTVCYGDYWSSSLVADQEVNSLQAYELSISGDSELYDKWSSYYERDFGLAIRPVFGENNETPIHVESILLDQTTLEITVGGGGKLNATILPQDATNQAVSWSSSNPSIVSVSSRGILTGLATGSATVTASSYDSGKVATCNVVVKKGSSYATPATPDPVDLGLSVKWASFNLGATKPEEFGDYFAWGEIEPKDYYCWENYLWCEGTTKSLTKYCDNPDYGYNGFFDNKTELDPEDDAACVYLGDKWRMPTYNEAKELIEKCQISVYSLNGVDGFMVTGPNENSVFFPAAGGYYEDSINKGGYYYSSTLRMKVYENPSSAQAWGLRFRNTTSLLGHLSMFGRATGRSIRAVYGDPIVVESVYLDHSEIEIYRDETAVLEATVLPSNAPNKDVYWESSNSNVAWVDPSTGIVTGVSVGNAVITVTTRDGNKTATCNVRVKCSEPEAIDLGLSVKWASFNLGAIKPDDYGGLYAWGEVDTKEDYSENNYKWCMGSLEMLTKYCSNSDYGYNGFVDGKTILDPEDDAARVNLGGKWRMPTDEEWAELQTLCTWEWTSMNAIKGCIVTGPNGNHIFLPVHIWWGWGAVWSSRLSSRDYCGCYAYFNNFNNSNTLGWSQNESEKRYYGLSVRPVSD